jgi:CRISPR/Cas system-associated endoribonuclease Cas2
MSKIGSVVQEVQEIVEDFAFYSEQQVIEQIENQFANRPQEKMFALEMARQEFRVIQEDLRRFGS